MNWEISGRCPDPVTRKTIKWNYSIATLANGFARAGIAYRGRPQLTARIREGFELSVNRGTRSSAMARRACVAQFWRFLDFQEKSSELIPDVEAVKIDDLDWDEIEALWRHFLNWLRSKSSSEMSQSYKYQVNWAVYSVFMKSFELALADGSTDKPLLEIYVYFKDCQNDSYDIEHIEFEDAKWAFGHLARAWRGILKRIERGRDLASLAGEYVPGSSGAHRWDGGYWHRPENRLAYLLRETPFQLIALDPVKLLQRRSERLRFDLPSDMVWEDGGYQNMTIDAHIASVFLRGPEIAVALAMVSMKTGLNVDSIARMPVDSWFRPDPFSPNKRAILFGPKRHGEHHIHASSSRTKHTDAYQIIQRVIEIQAPLRQRMKEVAAATGDVKLARRAKLIWIYPTRMGVKDILPGRNKDEISVWLDRFLEAKAKIDNRIAVRYRLSHGRDVWALFVYFRSGFNHVLTMRALGHSTLKSLLNYLEKKIVIIEERKKLIDLQGRVIVHLWDGKFRPRDHRVERTNASISGLFCSDPTRPDRDADPGNPGGRICVSQRCFACSKWYATKDSLVMLSRVIMDLEELRDTIALSIWETSEYSLMMAMYAYIRSKFHRSLVEKAIEEARHIPAIVQTGMFVGLAREARQ